MLEGAYISAAGEARVAMAEHCNGRFAVYAPGRDGQPPRLIDTPNSDQYRAEFVCIDRFDEHAFVAKGRP